MSHRILNDVNDLSAKIKLLELVLLLTPEHNGVRHPF